MCSEKESKVRGGEVAVEGAVLGWSVIGTQTT